MQQNCQITRCVRQHTMVIVLKSTKPRRDLTGSRNVVAQARPVSPKSHELLGDKFPNCISNNSDSDIFDTIEIQNRNRVNGRIDLWTVFVPRNIPCIAAVSVLTAGLKLTPPCVAESDQRHAQHPLKMLGIDYSCGSYQTNSEQIMLLNSWYQIDKSLYSNRYLFVRSKIGGQKWQPHILCKTMSFFASRLTPWFAWQPRAPAQKTTRADMQILYSLLPQYLRVLNNVRGRYEKCIVPGNKDFWIR